MKFLIASDIHGSAYWCGRLLEAIDREGADRIILLGDLLYHGPRNSLPDNYDPKAVISMLNSIKSKIMCVRGNCDSEVDQMVLEFPIMADYALIEAGKGIIFATHGHAFNNSSLPSLNSGDILLHGHTHVPACDIFDTHIYINPGSAAIPKENSPHSYMILENGCFTWKELGELKEYKSFIY